MKDKTFTEHSQTVRKQNTGKQMSKSKKFKMPPTRTWFPVLQPSHPTTLEEMGNTWPVFPLLPKQELLVGGMKMSLWWL